MKLCVVTATTNFERAEACIRSWGDVKVILSINGNRDFPTFELGKTIAIYADRFLGTVPAFRIGVDYALEHTDADVIACLHDDLELLDPDWQEKVIRHFERHPSCGLAGFGGAIGLGSADLYKTEYSPMQLARIGFRSNLVDAEVHGLRSLLTERVACLDGFSQIGRREFFAGGWRNKALSDEGKLVTRPSKERPWSYLEDHGLVHHFQDGALGCLSARMGWETWYIPVRCRHYGGQTAVGDRGYHEWALSKIPQGDQGFWQQSHEISHQLFSDVLPLRV